MPEWDVTGDIRDLQFEDIVKVPLLDLGCVRVEDLEFHMLRKYNGGAMLNHFMEQARAAFLSDTTHHDGSFYSSGGCALFGLGMLKWRTLLIPETSSKAMHVEALLKALRAVMLAAHEPSAPVVC